MRRAPYHKPFPKSSFYGGTNHPQQVYGQGVPRTIHESPMNHPLTIHELSINYPSDIHVYFWVSHIYFVMIHDHIHGS
jgi:hypothetical protein